MKNINLFIISFLFALLLNPTIHSQSITKTEITFPSNLSFTKWIKTSENYTVGMFTDHHFKILGNYEYIVAFDEDFDLLWAERFSKSTGFIKMIDLAIDFNNDINVLVWGDDIKQYLTKLNSNGDLIWKKNYWLDGAGLFRLHGILPVDTQSSLLYGGLCTLEDFVIKIDSVGEVIWVREYDVNGSISNAIKDAQLLNDNTYCMLADDKFFSLLFLDSLGNLTSDKIYSWSDDDVTINKLIRNTEGDLIIAGAKEGSNFIIKTNEEGEIIWANQYVHLHLDKLKDISELANGHYLVTASLAFPGAEDHEGLIYIIDNQGEIYWTAKNGNTDNEGKDFYNGIYSDPGGEFILAGHQEGNTNQAYFYRTTTFPLAQDFLCDFESVSLDRVEITNELVLEAPIININTADIVVLDGGMFNSNLNNFDLIGVCDVDFMVGNEEVNISDNITIFPNPVGAYLAIESSIDKLTNLEIFDVLGTKVKYEKINLGAGIHYLSISDLKTGIYFITISDLENHLIKSKRVIKQ